MEEMTLLEVLEKAYNHKIFRLDELSTLKNFDDLHNLIGEAIRIAEKVEINDENL